MNSPLDLGYAALITRFVRWAESQPDIRGALMIGSRARQDHRADEWSDLDIVLFAVDPQVYINSADWVEQVGEPCLSFVERTPGDGWERRVLFAGGLDVDFAINPAESLAYLTTQAIPPDMADILRRGTRVLVDKDACLAHIVQRPLPAAAPFQPPSEAEFLNVVNDFWYHTLWTAKHLRRGELWWAKSGLDMRLKERLVTLLTWHAHAIHGPSYDTWMRGRFLEEWADPRAVQALAGAFAHYDAADIARALLVTMDLFRWLALETARHWEFSYPTAGAQSAAEQAEHLLAGLKYRTVDFTAV